MINWSIDHVSATRNWSLTMTWSWPATKWDEKQTFSREGPWCRQVWSTLGGLKELALAPSVGLADSAAPLKSRAILPGALQELFSVGWEIQGAKFWPINMFVPAINGVEMRCTHLRREGGGYQECCSFIGKRSGPSLHNLINQPWLMRCDRDAKSQTSFFNFFSFLGSFLAPSCFVQRVLYPQSFFQQIFFTVLSNPWISCVLVTCQLFVQSIGAEMNPLRDKSR